MKKFSFIKSNMLTIFAIICAISAIVLQAWQKNIDDNKNEDLAKSLIEKHERLDRLILKANKQLTGLSNYVTGGNNKPIFTYHSSGREPLFDQSGKKIGNFYRVKLYLTNIGNSPLQNITIAFSDNYANSISEQGILNPGPFTDGFKQEKTINLITKGAIKPFYELRIPENLESLSTKFMINWNADFFYFETKFTPFSNKQIVDLTDIYYLDNKKNRVTDIEKFIGFRVNSLADYKWGYMLEGNE